MAKLIYTGSTLESDLNNMKEVNRILEEPCSYYSRKYDALGFVTFILTLLFILSSVAFAVSCYFSGFNKEQLLSAALILAAFIIFMIKLEKYNSQLNYHPYKNLKNKMYTSPDICKKEFGVEGENYTLELLQQLDDSYSIVYGYPVIDESRNDNKNNCELDFLILGPNGIFIIENKNTSGEIVGKSTDRMLKKYKESYVDTFVEDYKNPIRQISRQLSIFKKFLADNNLHDSFIKPIVYFCNEDCTLNIENISNVELLSAQDDLIGFIKSYNGRPLSGYAESKFIAFTEKYLSEVIEKNMLENMEKINEINHYISSQAFKIS